MPLASTIKAFFKNTSVRSIGIYTFTNFFAKGASFLLVFIFTNPFYISPSENGLLSLFSNSLLFLMPFLSMGVVHSTGADFFKLDKPAFRNFFTTSFVLPVTIMLLSTIVIFLFRDQLNKAYGFPPMFVWMIPVVTFLIFCNEQLLSLARSNNEPTVYLKANVAKTILELGLSFILVVYFAKRWEGRVEGILVAYLLTGVYGFYYFSKKGYLFGRIEKKYIYSELLYAVPIIALQASTFAMNASDKFFLSSFSHDQNETVGIYSIACIFASVINVLSMAIIQYLFPQIYSMLSSGNVDYNKVRKLFLVYLGIMIAGLAAVILLTPLLYHLFINPKYYPGLQYNYILCIGYFFWAIAFFFYSFLLYFKQKKKILSLSLLCIAISFVCNYFFIHKWMALGGAVSIMVSYFLVLLVTLFFTRNYWKHFLGRHRGKLAKA